MALDEVSAAIPGDAVAGNVGHEARPLGRRLDGFVGLVLFTFGTLFKTHEPIQAFYIGIWILCSVLG